MNFAGCRANGRNFQQQERKKMPTKKTDPDMNEAIKQPSRRGFLKGLSVAAIAIGTQTTRPNATVAQTPSAPSGATSAAGNGGSNLFYVVETTSGKVQGIATAGIKEFKGLPYGASTGGKNRFMPPKKPAPWTGVRECFGHGQVCPQTPSNLRSEYGMMIQWDQQSGG